MQRILVLNERDAQHPRAGGAETHVMELFSRMAERGFEVTLASCSFAGATDDATDRGVRIRRLGRLPGYYARAARFCAVESRAQRVDVVVECLNKAPYLAPFYSRAPVVALCHHLFGATAFQQVAWPVAAAVWLLERLIPVAHRRSHVVAISESTRDDLVARGLSRERIEVQPPGIRRPRVEARPIAERGNRIVYAGRLERYKRVDVLLRACALLAPRFPDLSLHVLGRGSDRARLERLASDCGVAERTRFEGFVPDDVRDRRLAEARVCVCPSLKEGWGLTVIEANAVGTPNVVADTPGLRDSVIDGETGFRVPADAAEALADRIARLLSDDALASRMSERALAWSRRFDWSEAADRMQATLRSALSAR